MNIAHVALQTSPFLSPFFRRVLSSRFGTLSLDEIPGLAFSSQQLVPNVGRVSSQHSWAQIIIAPQPPEYLGLQVCTTITQLIIYIYI